MSKEKFIKYFQDNFSQLKELILSEALWNSDPNYGICLQISKGLIALANNGDKNAAALYFLITVYDNHADSFSEDVAIRLLVDTDALDVYHNLLEEEIRSIVDDEELYDYYYSFPAVCLLERIADADDAESSDEEKTEQE